MLFDDTERTDSAPKGEAESTYRFLNRSAKQGLDEIRRTLHEWYSGYPESHRKDFVGRFRSHVDRHHRAAFFELFMHELLMRLGYSVTVHPSVAPADSTQPDFLVCKGDLEFYVEATVSSGISDADVSRKKVLAAVLDRINDLDVPYHLQLISVKEGLRPPKVRRICSELKSKLFALDVDALRTKAVHEGFESMPTLILAIEDWEFAIRPLPASPAAGRREHTRAIVDNSMEGGMVAPEGILREAIARKAGHYGDMNRPYMLAINSLDWTADEIAFEEALFGKEYVTFSHPESEGGPALGRMPNGVWIERTGPINTRLSAVLTFHELAPSNVPRVPAVLYHNPWARHPLDRSAFPLRQGEGDDGQMNWHMNLDLKTVFNFPADWPL